MTEVVELEDKTQDWNIWVGKGAALALALYSKKDRIAELLHSLFEKDSGKLKLLDWPRRLRSMGRMVKATLHGDYKNISPMLYVNMSAAFVYLTNHFKKDRKKVLNLGILNDIAVVILALDTLGEEIRKFEHWEVDQHVRSIKFV